MHTNDIGRAAESVISEYGALKLKIVTAESCTGGLVAAALTDVPGSSKVLERGFIAYSNNAKVELLGVRPETLEQFGAVSAESAEEMALGALEFSLADVSISVTGIAGPDGGSAEKPVGLVYLGVAHKNGLVMHYTCQFSGDRHRIRSESVREALKLLLSVCQPTQEL